MSDGRGQEYLDENFCTHDNVYIDDFYLIDEDEDFEEYINDVYVSIRCQNCGKKQDRTLSIENMLYDLDLGWED